jgi:hypothetical protein
VKKENNKFDYLSQIYEQFTEQNKENLMKTAKHLLKIQKEDAAMLANNPSSKNEKQS